MLGGYASTSKKPSMEISDRGHNHEGKFNKPLNVVKALISLKVDFTHEANTSKKGHSTIPPKGKSLYKSQARERSLSIIQRRRRNLDMSQVKGRSYNHMQLPLML